MTGQKGKEKIRSLTIITEARTGDWQDKLKGR